MTIISVLRWFLLSNTWFNLGWYLKRQHFYAMFITKHKICTSSLQYNNNKLIQKHWNFLANTNYCYKLAKFLIWLLFFAVISLYFCIVCFLHFMHICHARHYSTLRNVHYWKRRRKKRHNKKRCSYHWQPTRFLCGQHSLYKQCNSISSCILSTYKLEQCRS